MNKISNIIINSFLLLVLSLTNGIAEETIYYHHDALGSIVASTDEEGNIEWQEEYKPYGEKINRLGINEDIENTDWYTGKSYEEELDISYFGARWYDANQGRFLSIDPVGAAEHIQNGNIHGFNGYVYANNNPYRYVDPDGRIPILIPIVIFVAKELAAEAAEHYTGVPMPSLKNAGKYAGKKAFQVGVAHFGQATKGGLSNTDGIRFTQDSIGSKFSDGRSVQGLIDGLKSGKVSPNDIPAIRTFQKDGLTFTLDNRRLFSAHQVGVGVRTVPATAKEIARELPRKFTTPNQGKIIGIRGSLE